MRKRLYILLFAVILIAFTGCAGKNNTNSDEENITQEVGEIKIEESQDKENYNDDYDYMFGFGIEEFKSEDEELSYDGNPVKVHCYIDNQGKDFSIGIYLFIDGQMHQYREEDTGIEGYSHVFNVVENTREVYEISFVPDKGKKGDKLTLRFLYVLNPETKPNKAVYTYGHDTNMNQILPIKLNMLTDSESQSDNTYQYVNSVEMSQEEYDARVYDSRGNYRNTLKNIDFVLKNEEGEEIKNYIESNQDKVKFIIEGCGGGNEEYNLTAFINGVNVDYKDFNAIFEIKDGKYITKKEFIIDLSQLDKEKYNLGEYNSLFILAVPKSEKITSLSCRIRVITLVTGN